MWSDVLRVGRTLIRHVGRIVLGGFIICGRSLCGRVPDRKALFAMSFQHVGEAEALAARLARVRLLAGVCAPVPLHVGATGEALPADLAYVRLLTYDVRIQSLSEHLQVLQISLRRTM